MTDTDKPRMRQNIDTGRWHCWSRIAHAEGPSPFAAYLKMLKARRDNRAILASRAERPPESSFAAIDPDGTIRTRIALTLARLRT